MDCVQLSIRDVLSMQWDFSFLSSNHTPTICTTEGLPTLCRRFWWCQRDTGDERGGQCSIAQAGVCWANRMTVSRTGVELEVAETPHAVFEQILAIRVKVRVDQPFTAPLLFLGCFGNNGRRRNYSSPWASVVSPPVWGHIGRAGRHWTLQIPAFSCLASVMSPFHLRY